MQHKKYNYLQDKILDGNQMKQSKGKSNYIIPDVLPGPPRLTNHESSEESMTNESHKRENVIHIRRYPIFGYTEPKENASCITSNDFLKCRQVPLHIIQTSTFKTINPEELTKNAIVCSSYRVQLPPRIIDP